MHYIELCRGLLLLPLLLVLQTGNPQKFNEFLGPKKRSFLRPTNNTNNAIKAASIFLFMLSLLYII
ncbi:hypothetical protein [Methanobacterium sp.]|uniref:hypothetical protein n=1 Tax=Methanobacterium sp. TaxID=2164 RepID=UPI0031588727